jgi:hypothetical protein
MTDHPDLGWRGEILGVLSVCHWLCQCSDGRRPNPAGRTAG